MFGDLPKLLDRNFAVAFFVPAAMLVASGWTVMVLLGLAPGPFTLVRLATPGPPKGPDVSASLLFVIVIFVTAIIAIVLMALNYSLTRLMEGYFLVEGYFERVPFLKGGKAKLSTCFEQQVRPVLQKQEQIDKARAAGEPEPLMPADHPAKLRHAVESFPDAEEHVLPTKFGNSFRAIEVYSRVVYGIDAIPAWPRLEPILPEAFSSRLNQAKALLDFSINLIFVGCFSFILLLLFMVCSWSLPPLRGGVLLIIALLAMVIIGRALADPALRNFGEYVKGAFDLYRGELATQLGLKIPPSPADEREMWTAVSRLMIYRSAASSEKLARYRACL